MDFETLCIHGSDKKYDTTGAICVPIFTSATFAHPGVGQSTGFDYSRTQNPTREHLEYTIAALEGGCGAVAFSSGMAASAAIMELFSPNDSIVASADLYGGTYRLFSQISAKNGVLFSYADSTEGIISAINCDTKAVFIETPTNPMMNVVDIKAIAKVTNKYGAMLIVDNTFLTPYFQNPLSLGADVVLHSGTKYLSGHNDALAGLLIAKDPKVYESLRAIAQTTGAVLSPFESYLIIRGIKTLAIRMERQQKTAKAIADWLLKRNEIDALHYIGLPGHLGYETNLRQARGFGGMISFSTHDEKMAVRILEKVKIINYAESLGGVESLVTYPATQTHADIPEAERLARGINLRLLRLSVGLESASDLIADLNQAMEG